MLTAEPVTMSKGQIPMPTVLVRAVPGTRYLLKKKDTYGIYWDLIQAVILILFPYPPIYVQELCGLLQVVR